MVNWGFLNAVGFSGAPDACRASDGACWAVVGNNGYLFLFGTYPLEERWRAGIALIIVLTSVGLFILPSMRKVSITLAVYLLSVTTMFLLLLGGSFTGLHEVELDRVGGFMLTWLLAWVALPIALPLAVMLALGRQSSLPVISLLAAGLIDFIRGIPMIVVLFFAVVIFPLLFEGGASVPKVMRAIAAIAVFAAAYQAEILRGGLQAISSGQYEAAYGLGLKYWQVQTKIVLPQVFQIVVRPMAGQHIGFFKNTSLEIIGLFELTGITKIVITKPEWTMYAIETYVIVGVVYFVFCQFISYVASSIEWQLTPPGYK